MEGGTLPNTMHPVARPRDFPGLTKEPPRERCHPEASLSWLRNRTMRELWPSGKARAPRCMEREHQPHTTLIASGSHFMIAPRSMLRLQSSAAPAAR